MLKKIRYILELIAVKVFLFFFRVIGLKNASNFGSFLAKFIGQKLKVNKLAINNMKNALPNLTDDEISQNIEGMWDNLGRICGEYIYVGKMKPKELDKYTVIRGEGQKRLDNLRKSKIGGIIISGHIANWEIGPKFFLNQNIKVKTVYRPLNNPYVEKLTANMRGVELIQKSSKGSREIVQHIKDGGYVLIMADQKVSEGEPVKFFHKDAITTTSMARIALKYNVPIIPARCVRDGQKFNFLVDIDKNLEVEKSDDINADVLSLTRKINEKLENWITQYPSQWFWVHNRWKS